VDADADGVESLKVKYPRYVHEDLPLLYGGTMDFVVRRIDVERWQGLYPALAAPASKAAVPTVSCEAATQNLSLEAVSSTTPASPPATKRRGSRQQRMIQQIAGEEFPDGCDQIETGVIIHKVANRLKRQNVSVPKCDTFLRALGRD
jgi:hypothetical protein